MNMPSLKVMPKYSASAGKSACDALVSGPRAVILVLPPKVAITISQLLTATEVKVPARSLWVRQIISTKDEFAGLVSNANSMLSPVGMAEPPDQLANAPEAGVLSPFAMVSCYSRGRVLSERSIRHEPRNPIVSVKGTCRNSKQCLHLEEVCRTIVLHHSHHFHC